MKPTIDISLNNEDDDTWDDSELIEAYNASNSKFKDEIEKYIKSQSKPIQEELNNENNKKPAAKKICEESILNRAITWNVGDACLAVYKTDNLWYAGIVTSISPAGDCQVIFDGYGNHENCSLGEMLRPEEQINYESLGRKYSDDFDNCIPSTSTVSVDNSKETKEKLAATTNALSLDANTDCSKTLISDNEIDTTADDDEIDVLSTLDFADSMMPPVGGGDLPRPPRTHNEALRVLLRSYYVAGYNMGMMRAKVEGGRKQR